MLGGQFSGRIRAKPEVSKLGTLKKATNVKTLKKEAQAKVSDLLGRPKKSLLQETKAEVKKAAREEAVRVQEKKATAEAKKRAETSKILTSDNFLKKLSNILNVKKDALKVKSKDEIVADTNAKINELKNKAVEKAEAEAKLAKDIKLEANKSVLNQKINDLNERITGLKNRFFDNINNVLRRASPPNRIRDSESGRIDRNRAIDAEIKAKRLKDSDTKDTAREKDQKNKTDNAKDDGDFSPLERTGRLEEDSVNVRRRGKDAEDDANRASEGDTRTKNEKNENDGSTRAKDDTRNLDTPRKGLESEDTKVKAKKAEDDAKKNKDGDEDGKNKSDDESKKTDKAKDDSGDLNNPRRELDSDTAKKRAKDADDDATKAKDGDAEGRKKDGDERNKTDQAEGDAKKIRDTDDSKKVKEDAENQRKKDTDDNKKVKDENSTVKKVFDGLNKLSNLLGLIGITLTILPIITPLPPPPPPLCSINPNHPSCVKPPTLPFCQLNPMHPSCSNICVGPLCSFTIQQPETYGPPPPPPPAPPFAPPPFPELKGVLSYLLFTIQNNPENDVYILLEPNDDDKIKFDDTKIEFPKNKWNETVRIPFYISVPDLSGNEEFESMPVERRAQNLKQRTKNLSKQKIQKDKTSLRAYYPSQQEINSLALRLKYLLDTSDTDLEKALQQIHENIRIKRQLGIYKRNKEENGSFVEPTYDDSEYEELKEDVIPTLDEQNDDEDDEENEEDETVEPIYSDSEYEDVKEDVEPTYDIKPSRTRVEFEPTMVSQAGGQEEESNEELASSEALPDDYKAYFTMRIVGDVKVPFDLEVISESSLYQTDPDIVSFGLIAPSPATSSSSSLSPAASNSQSIMTNEIAVFSSETFNLIQNTFTINNAYEETEQFNQNINNEYINQYEDILEEREYADADADKLYNATYNRSFYNTNRQISEAEYLRNQLITGGKQKYFTRKIIYL